MLNNKESFVNEFKDKNILVTGGTGSIGSEIVRQILNYNPRTVRIFARGEYGHHCLMRELGPGHKIARFIVGDIRDKDRLKLAMEEADIVFHAAAMKHVDICDNEPMEVVKTNIIGTQNVIDLARDSNVEKVVAISTDKAVNPEGILGVSKLMAEKLILNSYYYRGNKRTKYTCVRFGNVLGSAGSILPVFKRQIYNFNYVTITDPEMTRFVMSIQGAVRLVLRAAILTEGHEIFVLKMPAVKISDLADAAVEYYAPLCGKRPSDIEIKIIGSRLGEKKHEQLLADHEAKRVAETEDMFILPPRRDVLGYNRETAYEQTNIAGENISSEHARKLNQEEIMELIKEADKVEIIRE